MWNDTDGDGAQDAGEAGVTGVTINLRGDFNFVGVPDDAASTPTGADGAYLFANLPSGTYTVSVDTASLGAYQQTYDLDGLTTPNAATLVLPIRAARLTADFGYRPVGHRQRGRIRVERSERLRRAEHR